MELTDKVNEMIEKKGVESLEPFFKIGKKMCDWSCFEYKSWEAMPLREIPALSYDDLRIVYNTVLKSNSVGDDVKEKYEWLDEWMFNFYDRIIDNFYNPEVNNRLVQQKI